jgi:hypothetical protein
MPSSAYLMLRSAPAQPERVSKHAQRLMQQFLPSLYMLNPPYRGRRL